MTPRQLIIQAGGRGSRLEHHTRNRPKCLVPVDGKPLLYHTLDAFPGAEAVVIVDYRADVVERWLEAFPPDKPVRVVHAQGKGTAAGIRDAAAMLRQDEPVAVVWCDLVFSDPVDFPYDHGSLVCTTKDFPCRLTASDGNGVMGLFFFERADTLLAAPEYGEFASWPQEQPHGAWLMEGVREYGTVAALQDHWSDTPSRFFNEVEITQGAVVKRARLPEYASKLQDEAAWYAHVLALKFGNVPRVSCDDPLTMERISGRHPCQMKPDTRVMNLIMDVIERLHGLGEADGNVIATMEHGRYEAAR